jgi:hypothetical protein
MKEVRIPMPYPAFIASSMLDPRVPDRASPFGSETSKTTGRR